MYKVLIVNSAGETLKTYEPDGCYVIGGSVNDKLLTLDRVKKTKRGYTETSQDHIVNSSADDEAAYGFAYAESDKNRQKPFLKTGETIEEGTTPQILYAKTGQGRKRRGCRSIDSGPKQTEEPLLCLCERSSRQHVHHDQ